VSINVLVAEDDPKQAELVRVYLAREGYQVKVVGDGQSALRRARSWRPHLVVLDVMLPGLDGLDVCRTLRQESEVAILLLTARSTQKDMLLGLDLGADDYMTKPFSPRELVARARALLRRVRARAEEAVVRRVGDLEIDTVRFEVRRSGQPIALTAKEFAIVQVLAGEPGRAFTRTEIIDRAFPHDSDVLARTVDAHVMNLRRKLEDDPARPEYVQTVHGRSYRLAGP
jgi:DNA-binding response OmpR family regulator